MPHFYRYIAVEITAVFFAITLLLLAVILSFRLANLLGQAANGDLPVSAIVHLSGILTLRFLVVLAPLGFALATGIALGRLQQDSEMTAAHALGISHWQVCKATFIPAIPLALLLLYMTLAVLPGIYRQQDQIYLHANNDIGLHMLSDHTFRPLTPGITAFADRVGRDRLYGFFLVYYYGDKKNLWQSDVIYAKQASSHDDGVYNWLLLEDGLRLHWAQGHQPQDMQWSRFEHGEFRIPQKRLNSTETRARSFDSTQLNQSPEHQAERQNRIAPALYVLLSALTVPLLVHGRPRQDRYGKTFLIFLLYALYTNLVQIALIAVQKEQIAVWPGSLALHATALVVLLLFWLRSGVVKRLKETA